MRAFEAEFGDRVELLSDFKGIAKGSTGVIDWFDGGVHVAWEPVPEGYAFWSQDPPEETGLNRTLFEYDALHLLEIIEKKIINQRKETQTDESKQKPKRRRRHGLHSGIGEED